MYSNQQTPLYTTRHYIHNPQSNSTNYNSPRSTAQPYPYYPANQQPASVTYVNDRSNYAQPPSSYTPPSPTRYPSSNNNNHPRTGSTASAGGGGIEKTNMMSNENPFIDPARPYEQYHTPRTVTSITAQAKSTGSFNKTLNLSEENPFHSVYGGYHYPSQIDPAKRITTQTSSKVSTENKSLNLSDENPFFSTYGRYHYPSQIDPQKRITEMPKAPAQLSHTNESSDDNPFNNYRPQTFREYTSGGGGGSSLYSARGSNNPPPPPPPPSYRPVQPPPPPQNHYNREPSPPPRPQPQRANPSAPMDKTSLNMSPDNPFAQAYGQYHYPSSEEIKAQKRSNERSARFADQQPVHNNNNRSAPPSNQMTEYPEMEKKDVVSGKGNSKYTRFDLDF